VSEKGKLSRVSTWSAVGLAFSLLSSGCGEDEEMTNVRGFGGGAPSGPSASARPAGKGAKPGGGAAESDEAKPPPEPIVYRDEDFVESEKNRDPFRSYINAFRSQEPSEVQRRVIMPTTAVESMKLIAIIGGLPRPKAMLLDPMSMGHVVERGDYVGRPEVVQATGSVAMVLNWRVDRIRDNEVVLTRQDPTDPTRPALTRVIPLNEEVAVR